MSTTPPGDEPNREHLCADHHRALPRHQQQDGSCEHANQQDQGLRCATQQPRARIGDDLRQVDGDPDEHQPGEDPCGPRLGHDEVVPFVHVPLLLVVVVAVREV
jgi:hypothetical protein